MLGWKILSLGKLDNAFAFSICFYVIWLDAHLICNNNRALDVL